MLSELAKTYCHVLTTSLCYELKWTTQENQSEAYGRWALP